MLHDGYHGMGCQVNTTYFSRVAFCSLLCEHGRQIGFTVAFKFAQHHNQLLIMVHTTHSGVSADAAAELLIGRANGGGAGGGG
jgi:hypothetical protein